WTRARTGKKAATVILREVREQDAKQAEHRNSSQGVVKPRPIWDVLFEQQMKMNGADQCWLITQPAHSALSGEIAAKLRPEVFGAYDEATIRAIALHDAGWSGFDSELIRASRAEGAKRKQKMVSFVSVSASESVNAWTDST